MYTLSTTRFTNTTWESNKNYRFKNNISGCIYGSPQEMSPKILYDSLVLVVEMNNDNDRIEGIGLVRNKPYLDKYYRIYDHGDYNRFVYKSNYHIDREKLIRYDENLVNLLDYIVFKEKTHLKRGSGFTTITSKLLASKKNKEYNQINLNKIINSIVQCFKLEYLIVDEICIEETNKIEENNL